MKAPLTVTLQISGMPEALVLLREEMAAILREQADAEASGYVKARLQAIAAAFAAGQRPEG